MPSASPAATTSSTPNEKVVPAHVVCPVDVFAAEFAERVEAGEKVLAKSRVDFVGLARNCERSLPLNLDHARRTGELAAGFRIHIVENDSEDRTKEILTSFAASEKQATASMKDRGRRMRSTEWAGERTAELAEYREECRRFVESGDSDYTVVVDWDAWGSWTSVGLLNGLAYIDSMPNAYGMASVSLVELPQVHATPDGRLVLQPTWLHYDCWALRLNSYWDDYSTGMGGWKHGWLPPVGSPPVQVCSAFGGVCVYRTQDYLLGRYDGSDCEHVPFHRSIAEATGRLLYLNPSQRTVMKWQEPDEGASTEPHQP